MHIADRISRLGTETAFAVAARAAAHKAAGHEVFPFHLGDMNIPTPANVMDAACRAMRAGKTGYCPSPGIPELRDALAQDVKRPEGPPTPWKTWPSSPAASRSSASSSWPA
jgi:aspartate/methionine/tyrosine aminotransferase